MVELTFVIGVLNLCLGYALAVYFGYGPPTLVDAWDALSAGLPVDDTSSGQFAAVEEPSDAAAETLVPDRDVLPPEEPEEVPEPEELSEPVGESELSFFEVWDRAITLGASGLAALNTRLHGNKGGYSPEAIWGCVAELQEVCQTYLQAEEEIGEQFGDLSGESEEAKTAGGEFETAILDQLAQLETTLSNVQHMDFDTDLSGARKRLLSEIESVQAASDKIRDSLDAAF